MLVIYLSCAWLFGIWLGASLNLSPLLVLAGFIPLPLLFIARAYRKQVVIASLSLITLFSAAAYSYSSLNVTRENQVNFYNDRVVQIRGVVSQDPESRDKTNLVISAKEISIDGYLREIRGSVLLIAPRYPDYLYGDSLLIKGTLETPTGYDDFNYRGYLAHQGIYSVMYYPEVEIQSRSFNPLTPVYSLRKNLAASLARVLPEPQASLAQAIILGIRTGLPSSLREVFSRSGTAHILAISGLHISIITGMLLAAAVWLLGRRRQLHILFTLTVVWFYALLTGMNAPVLRGTIMASLFLIAESLGRQRSGLIALVVAASVMVGVSPYILWDASFQLSFLAMAGLVSLFPVFRDYGRMATGFFLGENGTRASLAGIISDSLAASLAATLAALPLIAYYFGIVSFIGPLATLLALPALTGIVITGALAGVLGLVFPLLGQAVGWLAWLFISYLLYMVNVAAMPSISFMDVTSVSAGLLLIYYAALALAILFISRRGSAILRKAVSKAETALYILAGFFSSHKKVVLPSLALIAVLLTLFAGSMPDGRLHVSFLDVGEGDAILIQKGSSQVLIDGGPSPQAITLALGGKMPFWDRTLDLLILTHPHTDHLAGLVEVAGRFNVKQVLFSPFEASSPLQAEWLRLIKEKKIATTMAQERLQIALGDGAVLTLLNNPLPAETDETKIDDDSSLVLRLSWGEVSFLFTGDISQAAEQELITQRAEVSSTVLKVPHHGSDTSTSPGFLSVVEPQIAVISVGSGNKFGHPVREVLDRLKARVGKVYRTDEQGTIEIITDGERMWVTGANSKK